MRAEYKPIFLTTLLSFLTSISVANTTAQFEDSSSDDVLMQANTDEANEAARYMSDMADFSDGCANTMQDSNLRNRTITECFEVVRDFNSNMSQLWDEHRDTIDYYRAKSGSNLDTPNLEAFPN